MKKSLLILILLLFQPSIKVLAGSSADYWRSILNSGITEYGNGNFKEALYTFEMCGNQHVINRYGDKCREYIPKTKKMIVAKAAEEKRIAVAKAAEEKRIADVKAAEEKKIADVKAAEEKKIADVKAAKEQRIAEEKKIAEEKIAKVIRNKELSLIPPETELEIAQQFLENIKTFIKLYPDEFDTIKIFEFILISRPIIDDNLDDKLKEDLKLFVEFTNKSNQFVKFQDEIEKDKIEIKLSKIRADIKKGQ